VTRLGRRGTRARTKGWRTYHSRVLGLWSASVHRRLIPNFHDCFLGLSRGRRGPSALVFFLSASGSGLPLQSGRPSAWCRSPRSISGIVALTSWLIQV
jgi:hypothetical protein